MIAHSGAVGAQSGAMGSSSGSMEGHCSAMDVFTKDISLEENCPFIFSNLRKANDYQNIALAFNFN
jgi:hypothetical protein